MANSVLRRVAVAAAVVGCWLVLPTAPVAQDLALPLKPNSVCFAVIGDNGTGDKPQYEVAQQMVTYHEKFPYTFVIMNGDNLYGGERPQDFVAKFEAPYRCARREGQIFATLGNHDDPNQRFPQAVQHGRSALTPSRKATRFFSLDSNYMDPVQLAWLREGAEGVRLRLEDSVLSSPLYTSGMHGSQVDLRVVLEPLFVKRRGRGLRRPRTLLPAHQAATGITYFVSGAAGQLRKGDLKKADFTAVGYDQDNSFMIVEIADKEMTFQAITRTGQTVDKGLIVSAPGQSRSRSGNDARIANPIAKPTAAPK